MEFQDANNTQPFENSQKQGFAFYNAFKCERMI